MSSSNDTPPPLSWQITLRAGWRQVLSIAMPIVKEFGLLFALLVLVIAGIARSPQAPELILLFLLYVITINFSLPASQSAISLLPMVAVTNLLVAGWQTAVALALAGWIIAQLAYPLWQPLWQEVRIQRPSLRQRLSDFLAQLIALATATFLYFQLGGVAPLTQAESVNLNSFIGLAAAYGLTHISLTTLLWRWNGRSLADFFRDNALFLFFTSLLSQPLAILASISFTYTGLPAFITFCLSIMAFSVLIWLSWQRRYIVEQQLSQFSQLNQAGASLRETLDLPTVLERTAQQIARLVPHETFLIALVDENGRWQKAYPSDSHESPPYTPDDFTQWVIQRRRVLEVTRHDLAFASQHALTPPTPAPSLWIGIPLTTAERLVGVMVLQWLTPEARFGRWSREVLLAIAGQASAAIENARLYGRTDLALAQRVKQLQALLDTIREAVIMIDMNGRILLINPIAGQILQQPPHELLGLVLQAHHAAALGYTAVEWHKRLDMLRGGQLPGPQNTLFHRRHPQETVFERQEAPVLAQHNQPLGWLLLLRDITEAHNLAERRADLSRMIVHDLRNPITTIISNLNLLLESALALQPAESHELLSNARSGCTDLLDLVDSLMDINRMETGQLLVEAEAMRLPSLAEKVIARLRPLAQQRGIALQLTVAPHLPAVWADEELIRRVLVNLLDNALKFTPSGGVIDGRLEVEPPVSIHHEPGVRCCLSDTGPGIPPEYQQLIFERFTRTNTGGAQVRGMGLGLTFCKLAIEAHNGRIWAESNPGGGSRFIFTLPGIPLFEE